MILTTVINELTKKIARFTNNNDHNNSVLALAEFLQDEEAIDKMEVIIDKHVKAGGMRYEWIIERSEILKGLLNKVTFLYGENTKKIIYSVF